MATSRPVPACLNPIASKTEEDPFLTEADFAEVWKRLEKSIFSLARAELRNVSLHRAEAIASGSDHAQQHLLANVGTVRNVLAGDGYVLPDIIQEVKLAMWRAIRGDSKGHIKGLRGSKPAVLAWLRTTVHFIVKQHVGKPAMLIFAAGNPKDCECDENSCPSAEPAYEPDFAEIVDTGRNLDRIEQCLNTKQVTVIRGLASGQSYREISDQMGISESYARGIFRRSKNRLEKLLGAREGPRYKGSGGACELGSTEQQTRTAHNIDLLELLTTTLERAMMLLSNIGHGSVDCLHHGAVPRTKIYRVEVERSGQRFGKAIGTLRQSMPQYFLSRRSARPWKPSHYSIVKKRHVERLSCCAKNARMPPKKTLFCAHLFGRRKKALCPIEVGAGHHRQAHQIARGGCMPLQSPHLCYHHVNTYR